MCEGRVRVGGCEGERCARGIRRNKRNGERGKFGTSSRDKSEGIEEIEAKGEE